MKLYDVHAHLADARILPAAGRVLEDCWDRGVRGILVNAARLDEWPTVVKLAEHRIVHGALGLHPFFVEQWDDTVPQRLRAAFRTSNCLRAVGEIGLDFQVGRGNANAQLEVLAAQLTIAREFGVPVILHNRRSWNEFFGLLRDLGVAELRGVCHHFTGSIDIARHALDRGLYLSFCGPLTYPNARRLKKAAAYVPLERVLTETDTPDLPPQSCRGQQSMPYHVKEVLLELSYQKGLPLETVAEQVEANYLSLLRLPEGLAQQHN